MKKKYIIIILTFFSILLLMGQSCGTTEKKNTKEKKEEVDNKFMEEDNEEEISEEKDNEEEDNEDEDNEEEYEIGKNEDFTEEEILDINVQDDIGGADFNLLESWNKFEERDYSSAAELLGLSAEYLEGEGEDLGKEDSKHLQATISAIKDLKKNLENEKKLNLNQTSSSFAVIGLNLTKDYLAIAIAINESPEDGAYYVTKAIDLLARVIHSLNGAEKEPVNELLQSLKKYDERVSDGTLTEADDLQVFADKMQQILNSQKVSF